MGEALEADVKQDLGGGRGQRCGGTWAEVWGDARVNLSLASCRPSEPMVNDQPTAQRGFDEDCSGNVHS